MLDAGLGPKVRKPSAYVVKAIKNKIAEAAAEAAEAEDPATDEKVTEYHKGDEDVEDNQGDEDVGDNQGDETWYEDEGGAEGYSRAENDRDDEDDGAWYRGGWHDDDYAEKKSCAEDEQSMSPSV